MFSFCGMSAEVSMFKRQQFEMEVERSNELLDKIADQRDQLAATWESIQKLLSGNLEKLAGANGFTDRLAKCADNVRTANQQIAKIRELQAQCSASIDAAKALMPAYASEVAAKPDVGSRFFLSGKGDDRRPFEPSRRERAVTTTLAEVQLGRRFSKGD